MRLIKGTPGPWKTGEKIAKTSLDSTVVEVTGPYSKLKSANPAAYVPAGYDLEGSELVSTGDGMGKLSIRTVKYDSSGGSEFGPVRTTFRVEMEAVQYPLQNHPYLAGVKDVIAKWLATDEAKRVQNNEFYYVDATGAEVMIQDNTAKKFCRAYMAGIETFNRYYPVIQKISIYKNPPGLNRTGTSFSGGSPQFSDCGEFDTPPISLSGYSQTGYFKSKDSWEENADKTWNRTEEWTWSPHGSDSDHAWIYDGSTPPAGNE